MSKERALVSAVLAASASHTRAADACLKCMVAVAMLVGNLSLAQSPGRDAQAILKQTGISGGLCLMVGARSSALAEALAETSSLYVHVLSRGARHILHSLLYRPELVAKRLAGEAIPAAAKPSTTDFPQLPVPHTIRTISPKSTQLPQEERGNSEASGAAIGVESTRSHPGMPSTSDLK